MEVSLEGKPGLAMTNVIKDVFCSISTASPARYSTGWCFLSIVYKKYPIIALMASISTMENTKSGPITMRGYPLPLLYQKQYIFPNRLGLGFL